MTSMVTITLFENGESRATEISVGINEETVDWNLVRETMRTMISNVSFDPEASTFRFTVKEIK